MACGPRFPLLLLLLLGGGGTASRAASSFCNVTCSTDYDQSVNCSCSGAQTPLPVLIQVSCRGEDQNVTGSCSVTPPLPWCQMLMEDLYLVASVGTWCTSAVSRPGDAAVAVASSWALADVVKPSAPFDVRVTDADGFVNVTWSVASGDSLLYNVCIRENSGLLEDSGRCFEVEERHLLLERRFLLQRRRLQPPAASFVLNVQAKMSPANYIQGPWSEWSPPALWRPRGDGVRPTWWFVSLPVVFVLGFVLLAYLHKPFWQKKLQFFTFVPKPDHFFEPLYQNYQGNFKDWVKSGFSEFDYDHVGSNLDELPSGKRPDVLLWSDGGGSLQGPLRDGGGGSLGGGSLQRPLRDGGSGGGGGGSGSQGTSPSIHTVTLSGEENEDGSLRSSSEEEEEQEEGEGERRDAAEAPAPHGDGDLPEASLRLAPPADEAERASLDSFASASRHSEDGYPRVDLDTIDSGFGECGSPGGRQAEPEEEPFGKHRPSDYVRQWMFGAEVRDDGRQEALSDSGC